MNRKDAKPFAGLDPRVQAVLVDPRGRGALRFDPSRQEVVGLETGLAYPVRNGIPVLVADEARQTGKGHV